MAHISVSASSAFVALEEKSDVTKVSEPGDSDGAKKRIESSHGANEEQILKIWGRGLTLL